MDPTTGNMWYTRNGATGGLWKYTKATDSWASTGNSVTNPNYCGVGYDYTRSRMLIVGSYEQTFPPKVHSGITGAQVSATFGGLGAGVLTTIGGYPNVTYDEYNDRFLVFKNTSPLTCYTVNPSTWEVQQLSMTNAPNARQNGLHNALQYIPSLRCVVVQMTYTGNMWCMRLN
jgi:hypothetical protein